MQSRRVLSKWDTIMEKARKKLSGGAGLEAKHILNKENSRDMIGSMLLEVVNAGHELAKHLDENIELVQHKTKKCEEKSNLLKSFTTSYDDLKNSMEQNFRCHYEKLEKIDDYIQTQSSNSSQMITEMKTFADIVKSSSPPVSQEKSEVYVKEMKSVVKGAVKEVNEAAQRASRFMIFNGGIENPEELADEIICATLGYEVQNLSAKRLGTKEDGPVCVQLQSPDMANLVLRNAGKLKLNKIHHDTYISPDRTYEERQEYKILVDKLKKRINDDPGLWWTIRNGKVVSSGPRKLKGSGVSKSNNCDSDSD